MAASHQKVFQILSDCEIGLHHTHKEKPHIVPLTQSHGEENVNKKLGCNILHVVSL